ncbi:uncharacterized protein NPIL_334061 [Nephila pilipes]|uniref:Peptidase aspartic putative domain-containing protein n=1 Tax=Nephila pilipes TaxID=299642 RepID=A0A8X6KL74_NEPPI|nr:uncharacterized protein NPIL_334061 [Nephila pilipes]
MVTVFDLSGQGQDFAVLLDSGSEATFISESLVNKLRKRSNACGTNTVDKLSDIMHKHGFHLRIWRSISTALLEHLSSVKEPDSLEIQTDECAKTFGLIWNSEQDHFKSKVSFNCDKEITKQLFLSQSAKLFDLLGLLHPETVITKIMYQQQWLLKLDWNCPLPGVRKEKLIKFQDQFKALEAAEIQRWLHTISKSINLHGFCDASELANSAVISCCQLNANEP